MAASKVFFGTSIAAINNAEHLRVYWQTIVTDVRESSYKSGWGGGVSSLGTGLNSKLTTPLAASSKGLANIRLYYVTADNKLAEQAYDQGSSWYAGTLNKSGFAVAPYSKIAAVFLPGSNLGLRVYVQSSDDTIQEYAYDSGSSGWQKGANLGVAFPGTHIAATSYTGQFNVSIRTYFQSTKLAIVEKAYDDGWFDGAFTVPIAPPRAAIAAINFNASKSGVSLRVYYASANNLILEKAYDDSWYDGIFKQASIPASKIAAIVWGGPEIRVYFQNGTQVSGITECAYTNGGWVQGRAALPPDS